MTHYQIAALYVLIGAAILLVLAANCVGARFKYRIPLGHAGNDAMERLIRAHANAAEHIPIVLIMLVLLALLHSPIAFIHTAGIALAAGRIIHAVALSRSAAPSAGRFVGQVLTFAAYLAAMAGLSIALLK